MGWLRKFFRGRSEMPDLDRDDEGRVDPSVAPQGWVVFHVPAGIPGFDEVALELMEAEINDYTLRCAFPVRFLVVQAQIEGVG